VASSRDGWRIERAHAKTLAEWVFSIGKPSIPDWEHRKSEKVAVPSLTDDRPICEGIIRDSRHVPVVVYISDAGE
jgi:hypothetical protein